MTLPSTPEVVAVGDVVQIDAEDPRFAYCFLTVTEVKSWGVQGFVAVPDVPRPGEAYYRVTFARCVRIGRAEWVPAELETAVKP